MKTTAEDLIPRSNIDVGRVITDPTYPYPLTQLDKYPTITMIPDKVWKIGIKIGGDNFYALIANALFNVSMGQCITGDRGYIKKFDLSNDEINCISTWLEKEEKEFKQDVGEWRNHIFNVLFNNYRENKTTFSEFKARHFIQLWTRHWLDHVAREVESTFNANEFVDHLVSSHINLDRIYLEAWVKYETPGMGSWSADASIGLEVCVEECLAAYDEAPYMTEPDRKNEHGKFLPTDGLRKLMTGPKGNRYPSPKRRKEHK